MGLSPNPAVELGGGMKTFISGAPGIDIPYFLMLTFLLAFIAYNAASLFDLDPGKFTSTYNSFVNWLKSVCRSVLNIYKRNTAVDRMLMFSATDPDQAITVNTDFLPDTSAITIIRGLPSSVTKAELRRFLETALYIHYQPGTQAGRNSTSAANRTVSPATDDDSIYSSSPGFSTGACVRHTVRTLPASMVSTHNVSTPSTPSPNSTSSYSSTSSVVQTLRRDIYNSTLASYLASLPTFEETTHEEQQVMAEERAGIESE